MISASRGNMIELWQRNIYESSGPESMVSTKINDNYDYFIIVLLICISTDIGGYIFGKILKGPKLTKLSPKKTFSGMFGSFICSFFITFILIENSDLIFGQYIKLSKSRCFF